MAPVNLGTGVTSDTDADGFRAPVGAAVLAGQCVYEGIDGKIQLASTASDLFGRRMGIAMNSAPTVGQEVYVQTGGTVLNCATIVKGATYYASDTPGSVCTAEGASPDLATNDWVNSFGVAKTTTSLRLRPFAASVQHA